MDGERTKSGGGSYMYYRDYQHQRADIEEVVKENHKTKGALLSKIAAKLRGRAGRFRGKSGTRENNKARGGKMAR